MGIDLDCNGINFHTSYSGWNTIRMKLAEYCMKFIEDLSKNELNISPDGVIYAMSYREIIRERVIIEAQTIIKEWNVIIEAKKNMPEVIEEDILQKIIKNREKEINIIDYLNIFDKHMDFLINIGIKGIFSLLNKSDTEGLYSIGDSYDVNSMLNIIHKMNNTDPKFIEIIDRLKNLFQASIDNKKCIIIS